MARKNSHLLYYVRAFSMLLTPSFVLNAREKRILRAYKNSTDKAYIDQRVDYYNQIDSVIDLPAESTTLKHHTYKEHQCSSVYFFDTFEYTRYFPKHFHWFHQPGDVRCLFPYPTVVKTRPLLNNHPDFKNSILLNQDKVRHFLFVKDSIPFAQKKPTILFRGEVHGKPERLRFLKMFMGKPGFDVGDTSHKLDDSLQANKLSIDDHFAYRYIMALEGNDVASNLKWVMSSNCIAVMPRPTCESWFMEGTLVPNYHYIEIKSDFSDLEERIQYYNEHIDEAEAIIRHAHEYVEQFKNKKRERIISYLVMKKYFERTSFQGKAQL